MFPYSIADCAAFPSPMAAASWIYILGSRQTSYYESNGNQSKFEINIGSFYWNLATWASQIFLAYDTTHGLRFKLVYDGSNYYVRVEYDDGTLFTETTARAASAYSTGRVMVSGEPFNNHYAQPSFHSLWFFRKYAAVETVTSIGAAEAV
jgi:hypothetical protein